MNKVLKFVIFFTITFLLFTGCVSTKVSETADYSIEVFNTSIEIRDSEFPMTIVMPVGEGRFPLVIFGEDDQIVDPKVSKATAEALGCSVLDVTGDTHSYSFFNLKLDIRSAIIAGTIDTFRTAFN